jgi:hypothetical protein
MRLLNQKINFTILGLFCCYFSLSAQTTYSQHFTINDGLPSNVVYCFLKDSRGIFWIGTENGLVKYDGYSFQSFTSENGLAGNSIWDIKEDKQQNLWIACNGDGLSKFDGKKFTNYSEKHGLVDNRIRTLYFSKNGLLHIGTEYGLSIWNGTKFYNYLTKTFDAHNKFQVMQFWEDQNQIYFLSRTHGYYEIRKTSRGYQFDSLGKNLSQTIFIKGLNENLYSNGSGLFKDTTGDQFPLNLPLHEKIMDNVVWDYESINGNIYLAAYSVFFKGGGLYLYKNNVLSNISKKHGIESDQIWNLYYDKPNDKLWVSTYDNGFYIIDLAPKLGFYPTKPLQDIFIYNDHIIKLFGDALVLANKVVKKQDFIDFASKIKSSRDINPFKTSYANLIEFINRGFELNQVKVLRDKIYVSSNKGLFILDKYGNFKSYIRCEMQDFQLLNDGSILCQYSYGAFYVISMIQGKWKFQSFDDKSPNTPIDIIEFEKYNDVCFMASLTKGLFRINSNRQPKKMNHKMLQCEKILSISMVGNYLYAAMGNRKILVFNVANEFKYVRTYDENDFIGETILKIEANKEALIVITNRGVNIIGNKKKIFVDSEQGLNLAGLTCSKLYHNILYIGTKLGYYYIDIHSYLESNYEYQKISLNKIIIGKDNIQIQDLWNFNSASIIHLAYDQNSVKLLLNYNEYYHPKKLRLSYRINTSNWELIRDKQISLQELSSGKYSIWIKQEDLLTGKTRIFLFKELIVAKPFWKSLWFFVTLLIFSVVVTFFWFRRKIGKIKREDEQKVQFSKRISETKMEALQSQMNPHFIFNSLTAIQNYVLKTDVDNALYFMGEFSKLIRQTLDFSSKTSISLTEEIDFLLRYVKLENMRYGDRVSLEIDFDNLETSTIMLPPLMIQPLIENAFEHGFIDQSKYYHLIVKIICKKGKLQISVIDNGEGISMNNRENHESKALKIIRERIHLLDNTFSNSLEIFRKDEFTTAQLTLPFITLN